MTHENDKFKFQNPQMKFYWNPAMHICIVYGCVCATQQQSCNCDKVDVA